jgi:hypothetical protein
MPAARKASSTKSDNGTSHVTEFELEKETKGAVRFQETPPDDGEAFIRSTYIRKELWEKLGKPEVIEMTLRAVAE